MAWSLVKEQELFLMVTNMKGNGKMGKLMVMEFLLTLTEKSSKGNGKMGKDGMEKGPITCL